MAVSDYSRPHYSERVVIPMQKIKLIEGIHKRGKYTVKGIPADKMTMVVRDLHDGTYALVTGWRAYQECRASDEGIGYCLVVNDKRYDFVGKYGETNKKVKNIKIPNGFKKSHISAEKVQKAKENAEIGEFKPITLSRDGFVIDGYSRLVAAKELGIERVPVVKNWKRTIVRKESGAFDYKSSRKT